MSFNELPFELHSKIAEYLPLKDRHQLQKCSRDLRAVHDTAPLFFTTGRFMRFSSHDDDPKFACVYFEDLELEFHNRDNGTDFERIRVTNNQRVTERTTRFEGEDYCEVAKRCFRDIFLKKQVSFGLFTTNCVTDETLFESGDQIDVQEIIFFNFETVQNADQRIDLWLEHMNTKNLKKFIVYNHEVGNCIIGNHSILKNLERFTVLLASDVTDELLLSLTATEICIDHSMITVEGVNQFIKNWVTRKVEKGAEFEYSPADLTSFTLEAAVEGLRNVSFRSNEAIIPIADDRSLHIWIRDQCVRVECLRKP